MMKIKYNLAAFEQIRHLPAVKAALHSSAEAIASACEAESGEAGFVAESGKGKSRSRAAVIAATPHAIRHNAKHNTILRNVDRGRK